MCVSVCVFWDFLEFYVAFFYFFSFCVVLRWFSIGFKFFFFFLGLYIYMVFLWFSCSFSMVLPRFYVVFSVVFYEFLEVRKAIFKTV